MTTEFGTFFWCHLKVCKSIDHRKLPSVFTVRESSFNLEGGGGGHEDIEGVPEICRA